jgi:hypothetical protein
MKKIHVLNGFDAMAEDFAKESHEAYKNAYEYGRVDGAQKYVQGIEVSS